MHSFQPKIDYEEITAGLMCIQIETFLVGSGGLECKNGHVLNQDRQHGPKASQVLHLVCPWGLEGRRLTSETLQNGHLCL